MATAAPVNSPCTKLCTIDDLSGWCIGCLRTIDEITAWSTMDDGAKRIVLQQLRERRAHRRHQREAATRGE